MYRTLLVRGVAAGAIVASGLWLACATIPDFVVGSGEDARIEKDGAASTLDALVPIDGSTGDAGFAPDGHTYYVYLTQSTAGDFGLGLGGLEWADLECTVNANNNGLGGRRWKALLWVTGDGGFGRIEPVDGGWHAIGSNALVFRTMPPADFDAAPLAPVTYATGVLPDAALAWTGYPGDGGDNCTSWQTRDTAVVGTVGFTGAKNFREWLENVDSVRRTCNLLNSLYCFEQP